MMNKLSPGILRIGLLIAMLAMGLPSSRAGIVAWTNTLGGNWSNPSNWSPNTVPSENDDVYISIDGTYDVSLDTSTNVNSFVIGGGAGTQTFHTGTSSLGANTACIITSSGALDLEGGSLLGPGTLTVEGTLNWEGGSIGGGGTVSVSPGGLVSLISGNDSLYSALTNAGAVALVGGNLQLLGACFANNGMLINLTNGLVVFEGDASINALCGTEVISNYGTVMKSGTMGISDISAPFYNLGKLDVESGTISLDATYSLTNGTVNFGISDLYTYGTLNLSGDPAQLAGTVSATLTGDYQPIATNEFPVITYASESGAFTNESLPYLDAWQVDYGQMAFSLIVLNARPMIFAPANQEIGEFSTLSAYAVATDADQPPQTLTFSLTNAPAGMTIDPATGLITWSPAQTQSPSTNTVTVIVTDNGTPPLSTNATFGVIVMEENVPPAWPSLGVQTVNDSSLLVVDDAATETNIHAKITGYGLVNPPTGAKINANGMVSWTPDPAQGPSTNMFVSVATNSDPLDGTEPILLATNSFTVIVFAPTLAPISNYTVTAGQTLTFMSVATDNDPTRTLTFRLSAGPSSASIGATNGVFVWTPGTNYIGTSNTFTISVSDNSVPPLSAVQSFSVYVINLPTPPAIGSAELAGGHFQFQVDGPLGPTYFIDAAPGLPAAQWTNLESLVPASLPFIFTDTNPPQAGRIYRVKVSQ